MLETLAELEFGNPWAFLLLLLPLIYMWRYLWAAKRPTLRFSTTLGLKQVSRTWTQRLHHLPFLLSWLALVAMVVAAARPQLGSSIIKRKSEGLDIVLAIDTSGSMRAMDLTLNGNRYDRLTVVKNVVREFVEKRPGDRIGMVVFGSEAYTQAPLTLDHEVVKTFLGNLEIGMAGPSTAIGDALVTASRRLADLESKSKILILLTDGENTAGVANPTEAAQAAATLGIKVYTIGVGSNGMAPLPVPGLFGSRTVMRPVKLDEELLLSIAETTGARSFLASDTETLRKIYATIDKLETTEIEVDEFHSYEEAAWPLLWTALGLLLLRGLLMLTRLRRLPA